MKIMRWQLDECNTFNLSGFTYLRRLMFTNKPINETLLIKLVEHV